MDPSLAREVAEARDTCLAPEGLAALELDFAHALAPPADTCVALRIDGATAGIVTADRVERLLQFKTVFRREGDALTLVCELDTEERRSAAITAVTRSLAAEGALTAWRNELYAARPSFAAPAWFHLERAAARYFGIHTYAAHANGLVATTRGTAMWIARRSPAKAIDPGMLDNLVGGGIAAGMGILDTLVKEAWEEAGVPPVLARAARATGSLSILREVPDGIQRETIYVHDLWLPAGFTPANQDGEACEHRCLDLRAIASLLAESSAPRAMTVDASLVALDCLVREGVLPPLQTLSARLAPRS